MSPLLGNHDKSRFMAYADGDLPDPKEPDEFVVGWTKPPKVDQASSYEKLKLTRDRGLFLLMDSVQCGHYRTGCFQSYEKILREAKKKDEFLPDAVSMAKSLGAGFPIGAVWFGEGLMDALAPGSHGTTYGGTALACAVALEVVVS